LPAPRQTRAGGSEDSQRCGRKVNLPGWHAICLLSKIAVLICDFLANRPRAIDFFFCYKKFSIKSLEGSSDDRKTVKGGCLDVYAFGPNMIGPKDFGT